MAISKIILNGVTQMDLTQDTVASGNLIAPNTAHGADGEPIVGTASGGGSSMNFQCASGINRVATTDYTAVSGQTLTVAKTGTYNIYWTGFRSSTGGTNGSQLYIDGTAHGSAQTTFSNHGQAVKLTGISLTQGQVLTVRARARGTNYYMYVGNLTIEQTT